MYDIMLKKEGMNIRKMSIGRINGLKIVTLRLEKNMSQEKLAELSQVSRCQIQRIESGKLGDSHIQTAIKLAKVLNVSIGELLTEEEK